jgi:hypothetical protein
MAPSRVAGDPERVARERSGGVIVVMPARKTAVLNFD